MEERRKTWEDCEKTVLAMQEYATTEKFKEGLAYMKELYLKQFQSPEKK
jgi:hypothetical protein